MLFVTSIPQWMLAVIIIIIVIIITEKFSATQILTLNFSEIITFLLALPFFFPHFIKATFSSHWDPVHHTLSLASYYTLSLPVTTSPPLTLHPRTPLPPQLPSLPAVSLFSHFLEKMSSLTGDPQGVVPLLSTSAFSLCVVFSTISFLFFSQTERPVLSLIPVSL